ncbi:MAG TPA: alkaline phosphatase family protein [Acidobacteriota bacterium]|jgi:predicted AlkP superfamily phosphohydrolase/phosphomutase|nr:alkaline phosphatase family protein [Acidobacteriota bacterium]HNT17592.1 alkaline phosphatase family protein [Acidobacteriota bacterium]HQO19665.1 alkaline phosphatase family protein [Acidobacteriota bacterium]HQQ46566.1 alkaline phosphatase family protein [Acidobacteriota bacterium]
MGRVIVIGWDGATWDLLMPLIERGVCPVLGQLLGESAYGPLRSTIPPVTAPSWITIATGVNPGRHGCFDFNKADGALSRIRPLQSWDIKAKTFYEVLEERKRPFVLINLPGTYPPLTRGITLTSLLTRGEDAVFPEELKEKSDVLKNYRIFPDSGLLRKGRLSEYILDIMDVEIRRFEALKELWERDWDVFFTVFSGGDWVSHELFGELLEGTAPKEAEGVFRLMDEALAHILRRMRPDDSLLMVSDHGFQKARGVVHLNEVLMERGLLSPDFSRPSPPPSHRMEEGSFADGDFGKPPEWLLRRGMESGLFRYAIKAFRKAGGKYPLFLRPDNRNSRASLFTSESYGITIHEKSMFSDGAVEPEEAAGLRASVIEELKNLIHDGEHVFRRILSREEAYSGEYAADAPHILIGDTDWALSSAVRTLESDPFAACPRGIHSMNGIFLGYGRAFRRADIPLNDMKVEDITPAILHLLGEPVPEGLDGSVPSRWFESDFAQRNPVRFRRYEPPRREPGEVEGDEIQKRLKGLGYMS